MIRTTTVEAGHEIVEIEPEASVELSKKHKAADLLLAQAIVANEIKLVSQLMTHSRDTSPYTVTLPKRIRFISKFGIGILPLRKRRSIWETGTRCTTILLREMEP